jgi:hypothetical protein
MLMNGRTTRLHRKLVVFSLLGVVTCLGGGAYAFAQDRGSDARVAPHRLTLRAAVRTLTMRPRATARLTLRIAYRDRRVVTLSVLGTLPRRTRISFTPSSTRTTRVVATIVTTGATVGRHRLRLLARSGRSRAIATVMLVVRARTLAVPPAPTPAPAPEAPMPAAPTPAPVVPAPPDTPPEQPTDFTIAGDLPAPLQPGAAAPLDLQLTNPSAAAVTITGITVSLSGIDAPRARPGFPCVPDDFALTQFTGTYGFTLDPASTVSLSEIGVPAEQLPHVAMLDRPVNQNGCKGASLHFTFAGTSTGGTP